MAASKKTAIVVSQYQTAQNQQSGAPLTTAKIAIPTAKIRLVRESVMADWSVNNGGVPGKVAVGVIETADAIYYVAENVEQIADRMNGEG